ncbi:MAG: hypothetical protein ACOCZ6_01585 [Nanoarchaeota archaeon]
MSYKELIQIYDSRREKLQNLLNDGSAELDEQRSLQIQGAIDEISMFISVLQQYHQKNTERDLSINGVEGKAQESFLKRMKSCVF